MLGPGEIFDRFRIEATIAEGGMGRVYRAFDTRLHRMVALKLLFVPETLDPAARAEVVALLLREARAAAALDHPNVVVVYEAGELDGQPYLVLELVAGRSLRDRVGDQAVPWRERVHWLADVARALAFAHRAGIVHRDIKPENVIVRDDGTVKVLDFGIARLASTDLGSAPTLTAGQASLGTLAKAGSIVGTPHYMAPEQLRAEPVDGRTDEFSWGVMAYELLSGARPWKGDSAVAVLSTMLSTEPEPLAQKCPELPDGLTELVMRTLCKEPSQRFASMDEVVNALDVLLATEAATVPVSAELARAASKNELRDSASARPPRRTARGRLLAWVAVGLVALGLGVGGWELRHRAHGTATSVSGSASAMASASAVTGRPTRIIDLEPSPSCKPDAASEYRRALQAFREANWTQAHRALERAQAADPDCPEVAWRLVLTCFYNCDSAHLHDQYGRAVRLRAALSERDRGILSALERGVMAETPSLAASHDALSTLAERSPEDAELAALAGLGDHDLPHRIALAERALAIDPQYADAWQELARTLTGLGRADEAQHAYEECFRTSPGSTDCLGDLALRAMVAGRCNDYLSFSKEWVARDAADPRGLCNLALALAATSSAREAIAEALDRCSGAITTGSAALNRAHGKAKLAALFGDFPAVRDELETMVRDCKGLPEATARQLPAEIGVALYEETGEPARAWSLERDFLARLPALEHGGAGSATFAFGPPTSLFAFWCGCELARHDGMPPPTLAQELPISTEWLAWAAGEAPRTRTRIEAQAALAKEPARHPTTHLIHYLWTIESQAAELAVRAGDPARELPLLREVAGACTALYDPFRHTRSQLWFGEALESTGDKPGACKAYDVVLARWGKAKPRSVTAEEARRRSKALGCTAP